MYTNGSTPPTFALDTALHVAWVKSDAHNHMPMDPNSQSLACAIYAEGWDAGRKQMWAQLKHQLLVIGFYAVFFIGVIYTVMTIAH